MSLKRLNKTRVEDPDQPLHTKKTKTEEKSVKRVESKYFLPKTELTPEMLINEQLIGIVKRLNAIVKQFTFLKPVEYCYNPAEYALKPYETYINKFCTNQKDILFIGMNPGPFGMCQTGVPFGEIKHVRDWMGINEDVNKPEIECPNRPIQGFSCPKTEQSGLKLWGTFKRISETPERFFKHAFVFNYCPLAFMDNKGKNVTPNMIKGAVRKSLEDACDDALQEVISILKPKYVVGIGTYASNRCLKVKERGSFTTEVLYLIHPSPVIPNNHNWSDKAQLFLQENNLLHYFKNE